MNFANGKLMTLTNRIPVMTTDPETGAKVAAKDEYGDELVTPEETPVLGAFDPGGSTEKGDATVDTRPAALLPPGTDVQFTSAITVDGISYEVDGVPQVYDSPFTGTKFGVRVPLKAQQRRP